MKETGHSYGKTWDGKKRQKNEDTLFLCLDKTEK